MVEEVNRHMTIFSSLDKAVENGFSWVEFRSDLGIHVVERTFDRGDGRLAKALAFAKPEPAAAAR